MPIISVTKKSVQIKQRKNAGLVDSKTGLRKNTHNKAKREK